MNLADFATPVKPLRASILPLLVRCPMAVIIKLYGGVDESGPAADTGSAVHCAVAAFHREARKDFQRSLEIMKERGTKYPLADLKQAEMLFRYYFNDERNKTAQVVLCEEEITFRLSPAETDPTQKEILIQGTLDQVREENGVLTVWDIKTGKPPGVDMLSDYALQLAAYQHGAAQRLDRRVARSGILRTGDYPTGPVFYEAPWTDAHLEALLSSVRSRVADIRAGRVGIAPNSRDCRYCVGVGQCTTLVKRYQP